jgi:hypothetical protein
MSQWESNKKLNRIQGTYGSFIRRGSGAPGDKLMWKRCRGLKTRGARANAGLSGPLVPLGALHSFTSMTLKPANMESIGNFLVYLVVEREYSANGCDQRFIPYSA